MTHLQKFRLPALIFAVCLSLTLIKGNALAAGGASPDSFSSVSTAGSGISFGSGISGYPNSVYIECTPDIAYEDFINGIEVGSGCSTLYSSTTPFTVVSWGALNYGELATSPSSSNFRFRCFDPSGATSGELPGYVFAQQAGLYNFNAGSTYYPTSYAFNGDFHCTGSIYAQGDMDYYWLQIVPYDTRVMQNQGEVVQSTSTMPLLDTHFGIIAGYFLAFWTMIFIVWLFKGQKRI